MLELTEVAGGEPQQELPADRAAGSKCATPPTATPAGWASHRSGRSGSHITQAVAKMNDTYFNTATYNSPAWRRLVMCQEIAHDFGLDHQDEDFDNANLGSCMDYTSDPDGPPSNEHPNAHDFAQIDDIYDHLDSTSTTSARALPGHAPAAMGPIDLDSPGQWGRLMRSNARRPGADLRARPRSRAEDDHPRLLGHPDADRAR